MTDSNADDVTAVLEAAKGKKLILSGDNPFPMKVPGIERSALKRPVTKEQCVDIATRIAYGMCQQLFEVINTKHSNAIDALNLAHTEAMERLSTALRAEMLTTRTPE